MTLTAVRNQLDGLLVDHQDLRDVLKSVASASASAVTLLLDTFVKKGFTIDVQDGFLGGTGAHYEIADKKIVIGTKDKEDQPLGAPEMALYVLFESINASLHDKYTNLDTEFGAGQMTLGQYGEKKATIEAAEGRFPEIMNELKLAQVELGSQQDRAVMRWNQNGGSVSRYIAWFVSHPHQDDARPFGAEARFRLPSGELYAYERLMNLGRIGMLNQLRWVILGDRRKQASPDGWPEYAERAGKMWQGLPKDPAPNPQSYCSSKPAAFVRLAAWAESWFPPHGPNPSKIDLANVGFTDAMSRQAWRMRGSAPFTVILPKKGKSPIELQIEMARRRS